MEPADVLPRPAHVVVARAGRGFAGAAVARAGFDVLLIDKLREIAAFIVLAPLIGLALGHGHGANDAQKTMGIILALLIVTERAGTTAEVPLWVVLSAHTATGLGTLSGGWRIVKTMGSKITRLQPVGGFAAESAAATTLFFTAANGILDAAPVGGPLGRREPGRVGVDPHDPRRVRDAAAMSLLVGVFE